MNAHAPPRWVHKRDGRLVPFERDKISQALFAATEALGRPDAFLARELADGVVHFLAQEAGTAHPTTEQISELILKVTRELGQPELAQAFVRRSALNDAPPKRAKRELILPFAAEERSSEVGKRARRLFERKAVYTRDLAAAMQQGLLRGCLRGRPEALDSLLLEPAPGEGGWGEAVLQQIASLQAHVSNSFVLVSPDHKLEARVASPWLRQLCLLLHGVRRRAVLHLNVPAPAHADAGPLFAGNGEPPQPLAVAGELLREHLRRPLGWQRVRFEWHVSDQLSEELTTLLNGGAIGRWTLDRKEQINLGDGISRLQPAALAVFSLGLERLLDLPAVERRLDAFLEKLPGLVAMAASAAAQKRAFLAKALAAGSYLAQGFLTHRASLCLRLRGLRRLIQRLLGQHAEHTKEGIDLARLIAHTVVQNSLQQGRARNLEICVGARWSFEAFGSSATIALDEALALPAGLAAVGAAVTLTATRAAIGTRLASLLKKLEDARIARLHIEEVNEPRDS